jgi:hypothetical protein
MKDIVKWSLQSAQEYIENRKNSHEMFGYDFMVDENYKVWLIEINSSPSMDYSTVRNRLCSISLKGLLSKVLKIQLRSSSTTTLHQRKYVRLSIQAVISCYTRESKYLKNPSPLGLIWASKESQ